ncbi:MAG TPA: FAD:protein FMN transferase [Thermoanaerobaculia bacterium]|nr:FAD:protein FMN transferase [Thermoanaerobaculia bacterium]
MLPALIIVFREGFEAFLTVAIIFAFLRKTGRDWLRPAVYAGIATSVAASFALGWVLMRVNQSLWEGILGLVAAVLVATFVVHVWRTAPRMKGDMEQHLETASTRQSRGLAVAGVFLFTVLMVTREGMETALMLIQVKNTRFILGSLLGIVAAALMSWAWAHYGHRINLKRFFQVTGLFLLLFTAQIAFYAIHELSEAEVLPHSAAIHTATEPFSPVGVYGKWFSVLMVGVCAAWLLAVSMKDRLQRAHAIVVLLIVVAVAPSAARADTTRAQAMMGTVCEITVHDDADAKDIDAAFAEGKRIEAMLSTWRNDSDLARFNAGDRSALSNELAFDLIQTMHTAAFTRGAFNPLVRPLIDIWKTRDGGAVPTSEQIAAALKLVDLANVEMPQGGGVILKNGAQFEEGAWGKGLAIDKMLLVFRNKGAARVRINLGGQIGQYGDQPFVAIADPARRDKPAVGVLLVKESISTSAGSEKSFTVGGRTFTHLLDPRSGVALPPRGSVSVIHNSAFTADMLSTALYVMGPEAGAKFAKEHDIKAVFITDTNEVIPVNVPPVQLLDPKFTLKK